MTDIYQERFEELIAPRLGAGGEITALAAGPSDRSSVKIAVGNREKAVQLFSWSKQGTLNVVWSRRFEGITPIAMAFMNNVSADMHILGCWEGKL